MSDTYVIYPKIIDELLENPGIGFIAAPGLMEPEGVIHDNRGNPVEKYKFTDNSRTWNHRQLLLRVPLARQESWKSGICLPQRIIIMQSLFTKPTRAFIRRQTLELFERPYMMASLAP